MEHKGVPTVPSRVQVECDKQPGYVTPPSPSSWPGLLHSKSIQWLGGARQLFVLFVKTQRNKALGIRHKACGNRKEAGGSRDTRGTGGTWGKELGASSRCTSVLQNGKATCTKSPKTKEHSPSGYGKQADGVRARQSRILNTLRRILNL